MGTICLIFTGWSQTSLQTAPWGTTGYVYWPAVLFTAAASLIFAPLGVKIAVKLPVLLLKRIFAIILLLAAFICYGDRWQQLHSIRMNRTKSCPV